MTYFSPHLWGINKKGSFKLPFLLNIRRLRQILHAVFLTELLNTASRIKNLLFTGVKRVRL